MSAIILENDIIHYETLGRGRPLIFLHSWVGSWRYWIPSMQSASMSYRAYALDLWGFGDTAKNQHKYTIKNQIQLIKNFMDDMGIGKTALAGHGLGAVVAVLFGQFFPEYVDRVIAIGAPFRKDHINERLTSLTPPELASWLLEDIPGGEEAQQESQKTDPAAIQESLSSMPDSSLYVVSQRLRHPCLFVHGEDDTAIHIPSEDYLKTLPSHLHQITFNDCGHFLMLEKPNKFNRLMSDFLALESGQSPRQLQLKEEWKRRIR
jgi:pimeloyl-ACP methyl ester carboxylesterase